MPFGKSNRLERQSHPGRRGVPVQRAKLPRECVPDGMRVVINFLAFRRIKFSLF